MVLPKGWVKGTLNDIISPEGIFIDGDWIESKDQDPEGEIRLIQLADIKELKFVSKSDRFLTRHKSKELGCTYLKKDDVLIARMPDPIGRACLFPYEEEVKYVTVVDVAIVRTGSDSVLQKWLMYTINAPDYRKKIQENASGSTRLRISRKNLGILELPLPPLPEQKRIVAKLDKLFAHLDQLKARLENVPILLKQFRQAVLTQAVTGKLTEDWREVNEVTPVNLLDVEKEKIKKGIKFKVVKQPVEDKFFSEPDDWRWCKLQDVSLKITDGAHNTPKGFQNGFPYLMAKDVGENTLDFSQNHFIHEKDHRELWNKCLPEKGDLLIVNIGAGTGNNALVDVDFEFSFKNIAIVKRSQLLIPKFLKYYFDNRKTSIFRSQAKGGAQPFLSLAALKAIDISIPPIKEQEEIVRRAEALFAVADKIEANYKILQEKIDQLPQAILCKAFRGELVAREVLTYTGAVEELSMAAEEKRIYNTVKSSLTIDNLC